MTRLAIPAVRVAVLLATLLAARSASAFCGLYVGGTDKKLVANASQVVLMREGTRTVLSLQNDYQGPLESFAMIVPVPVVLQKDNVKTLPREIFARLEQLDAPRLVEYWETDPCTARNPSEPKAGSPGKVPGAPSTSASSSGPDLGVTIEAQFTVGEYDIVVLGAKDSPGLDSWLKREGYKLPEGSEPLLRPSVLSGSKFFVARVDIAKVKMEGNRATLSPLRFHYDSPELQLPVRIGLLNSAGTQDLIVHVLGKGRRYEVANYPNVTIPTNLDVAESAKGQFGTFYAALFDRTLAQNPKAVVTEYSWDAGSCDPCPVPPLSNAELVTLGADVLPSVTSESELMDGDLLKALGADAGRTTAPRPAPPSGPVPRRKYYGLKASFVLTRLHARYTRDTLTEDLVFKEVAPLHGGREVRVRGAVADGGVELGAVVPSERSATNAFQGRYAIRHPWAGPIACAAPVRNVWGGPPNGLDNGGTKAALGLAYVSRTNVQLASFLRSDVALLDLTATGAPPSGVGTYSVPSPAPPAIAAGSSTDPRAAGAGSGPDAKRSGCGGCTTAPARGGADSLVAALAVLLALVASRARARTRRQR